MGAPRAKAQTGEVCTTCQQVLTAGEVRKGIRRCPACRFAVPRVVKPKFPERQKEPPKTTRSWWIDVPQGQMTATAQQEVPRMRRGITYFSQSLNPEAGHRLLKKMRSEL